MACKAAAVAESRRLSGKASYQAAYSACSASSPATPRRTNAASESAGRLAAIADGRCWLVDLAACAVASLAFGAAECVLTFRSSAFGYGGISVA